MSDLYKAVVYVGIKVSKDDIVKNLGIMEYEDFFDWEESNVLRINGHNSNINDFGCIHTDDDYICIGMIISESPNGNGEEEYPYHVDLIRKFEENKAYVSERLRMLGITIGEIRVYHTTMKY